MARKGRWLVCRRRRRGVCVPTRHAGAGPGGRGRVVGGGEVVSSVEMPDDGELFEGVLEDWLWEVLGSQELVHVTLLCE